MIQQEKDRSNHVGMAFIAVLFFLFASALFNGSTRKGSDSLQNELISQYHSRSVNAVFVPGIQLPPFQKHWISFTDHMNFRLYNQRFSLFSYNSIINQRITFMSRDELLIKHIFFRFTYHYFTIESKELPRLS
jgi:hypothetical protein